MSKSPSLFADQNGFTYASTTSKDHKKSKGQFFTPIEIAKFMASLSLPTKSEVTCCDPGCGHGILACALVEKLVKDGVKSIHIDLFELDKDLIPVLEDNLNYLVGYFPNSTISYTIYEFNYLVWANKSFSEAEERYDIIISNPPYFKLSKGDINILATEKVVTGITNIYAGFVASSVKLLKPDGEMIFIVPRSFTSGLYFKSLRQYLFKEIRLKKVHLFASRTKAFKADKVLQETIIFKADNREGTETGISVSSGISDLSSATTETYQITDLVDITSTDKILHLPTTKDDFELIQKMRRLRFRLSDHRIKVSTGRVVAFRASDSLFEENKPGTVPLIWMNAIKPMEISWPVAGLNKPQYISRSATSLLIPAGNYILQRRFSAKEDNRRLVCCPITAADFSYDQLGLENKTNFFYKKGGTFSEEELIGLSVLLNSKMYDRYFRMINGNINVSSTEMNLLPFPPLNKINDLGSYVIAEGLANSTELFDKAIDLIVFKKAEHLVTA